MHYDEFSCGLMKTRVRHLHRLNLVDNYLRTVDREYFGVTKVTWAKYSMSYNFVNLACISTPDILQHKIFPHIKSSCITIKNGSTQDGILYMRLPCYHASLSAYQCFDWLAFAEPLGLPVKLLAEVQLLTNSLLD